MTFLFPLPLKLIPLDGQVLGESDKASNPVAWRRQQRIQHGGLPPQQLDQGDPSPPRVLRSSAAEPCFTLGKEQLITAPSPPKPAPLYLTVGNHELASAITWDQVPNGLSSNPSSTTVSFVSSGPSNKPQRPHL